MERVREIEKSIIKKYRKEIWHPFTEALKQYQLIEDGDKIAVCISGGKDSMLLAKCLQELHRHGRIDFSLEFIVMNPGYQKENLDKIKENLELLNIPAHIFESDIFKVVEKEGGDSPCYLCARMRRGYLYSKAQSLGCNKIALGHHFNDVIETVMLNLLYNGAFSSMMPKLYSDHFEGLELIRPLYLVRENEIKSWARYNGLTFIDCACSVTKKNLGKRLEMKHLIEQLKGIYPDADKNIFHATSNINLDTILATKSKSGNKCFLDDYDSQK